MEFIHLLCTATLTFAKSCTKHMFGNPTCKDTQGIDLHLVGLAPTCQDHQWLHNMPNNWRWKGLKKELNQNVFYFINQRVSNLCITFCLTSFKIITGNTDIKIGNHTVVSVFSKCSTVQMILLLSYTQTAASLYIQAASTHMSDVMNNWQHRPLLPHKMCSVKYHSEMLHPAHRHHIKNSHITDRYNIN